MDPERPVKLLELVHERLDNEYKLLEKICDILETLKIYIIDSNIVDDINHIQTLLTGFETSPRALSRSEAAVQNTQLLLTKLDTLIKSIPDQSRTERMIDRLEQLETKFDVFLTVFCKDYRS